MFKQAKRFVAILLSVLMIVSSFSVVAYAEEAVPEEQPPFSMTQTNEEAISINKGDQKIGTANYYQGTGATAWLDEEAAFLNDLVAEDTMLLNYGKPSVRQYVRNADGTYTDREGTAADRILTNDYAANKIQNGTAFNIELGKFQDREADGTLKVDADGNPIYLDNRIVKQYGWDGESYYYDEWNGEKKRDKSVTTPYFYEAYTYRLGAGTRVSDIVIAGSAGTNLRTAFYEIYMTTGAAENVYDAENLVYTFNGHEYETVPVAQHYSFNNVEASTIGIKVIDTTNFCQIGQPNYFCAARIGMLDIYGTNEKALLNVSVSDAASAIKSVSQTTVDETDNYSIPAALYAENNKYALAHRYYRNNTPYYAGSTIEQTKDGVYTDFRPRMWDGNTNADIQQDGREAYKDADGNPVFFGDTTTYCYYDFEDIYEINEIRLGNHNTVALRYSDVTVYAGNDFESLFTESNKLTYIPNAFGSASVAAQGLEARYVGIKVGDTCWDNAAYPANDYLRMTEFDVLGKFKADADVATVKNYNTTGLTDTFQPVRDDMEGKVSLVKENPTVAFYNGDDVKLTAADTMKLVDGSIGSEFKTDDIPHADAEGNYVEGADVYTSVKYDLKKVEEVSEIVVASSSNEYSKAAFYKVYVSEDAEITAEDEVAAVLNAGAHEYYKNCAQMLTLPEGTKGQYVEVRFFAPIYSAADVGNGAPNASTIYLKLQELNIYGDKGYKIESGYGTKAEYFATYKDTKIKDSLIANSSIFDVENITYINYGTKQPDAPYQGTKCIFGSEEWAELSKGLTLSDYYNIDGDWSGKSYTETVYPCSGETAHKDGCPADDTCVGVARIIRGDDTLYQTVIYKLPTKAEITEANIYLTNTGVRLPSHYQLSFANARADLFTDKATTFDVNKIVQKSYDLITFDEAVTAKYFAVRVLCGVHPSIEGTTNTGSNFARVQHMAIQGEAIVCDEHDFKEVNTATCTENGLLYSECTICGYEDGEAEESPSFGGHDIVVDKAVAATCTEAGLTEGSHCTRCDEATVKQEVIDALGHDMVTDKAVDATCTEPGLTEGSHCTRCDDATTKQEVVDALGHTEKDLPEVPATCTEAGKTAGKQCTVCGVVTVAQTVVDALDHDMVQGEIQPSDKCGETFRINECSRCDYEEKEIVDKAKHTIEAIPEKDPTCTTEGSTGGFKCTVCDTELTPPTVVPARGHDIVVDKAVAPTCTETGLTEGSHCSRCADATVKQEVVDALGHTEIDLPEVPATCTTAGKTAGKQCSVCKTITVAQKATAALGHKEVALAAVAATCTTAGKTAGKQCSVCKTITVAQKATAALGHKEVALAAVAATYEKTGLTAGKQCSVCKKITLAQKVVPALAKTSLKKAKFTLKAKTYTGKALTQSFTVKLGSKTLKNKVDYTISYKNNKNIGKATVTIKGIGAYKDSVSKTFAINPKKLSGLKVKAGKKQLTVSWKKDSKVGGYEIVYATSKNFKSGKKTVKITKASTAKKVIKKLKSKKTYYVKVRSFKKVSGKTYYGAYTSVKKIKVK